HDLPGGAVAALVGILLEEGRLHRMELTGNPDPLDGDDLVLLVSDGEREAGILPAAIDMHRAGAALPVIAALLCPGELEGLAQAIKQGGAWIDLHYATLAVDVQRDDEPASVLIRKLGSCTPLDMFSHDCLYPVL